jgi:hypothetical protein
VATDYDALRTDVKESQDDSLEALKSASAPDPRSVMRALDVDDSDESAELPGEFINGELEVQIVPQGSDEFVCQSCFLVHHRSHQVVRRGVENCRDCEG